MKQSITIHNKVITYELQRKQVKNINLRIRNGHVSVSAPMRVPLQEIERFLQAKGDFITKAIERTASTQAPRHSYASGEIFLLFGTPLRLSVIQGSQNRIERCQDTLLLTLKDPMSLKKREQMVNGYLQQCCKDSVTALCQRVYPLFQKKGIPYPEIRFRQMKSRWGSCQTQKGVLTFSYMLTEVPLPCVEYVVVHEFAHFLHADHSPAFYGEVEKLLPDWKQRRLAMKQR